MKTRLLGSIAVAEIGLGRMSLSHAYGVPPADDVAERVLIEALEHGVTLFDTAALGDPEEPHASVARDPQRGAA